MVKFNTFSKKQLLVLTWWTQKSKFKNCSGIICDGAIRSGKTLPMSISFVMWAMQAFDGQLFGISSKSVGSAKRNVLFWLMPILRTRGYIIKYVGGQDNILTVKIRSRKTNKTVTNYFHIFGGSDESSYTKIQGFTGAGWLFDEVALQPESFVNQAVGRCSVEGSKVWYNCNPDKPSHWFKKDYIDKAKDKELLHLHFLMNDNPSLSKETIADYYKKFTGVFFLRYILGKWALAEGVIYDMLDEDNYYSGELTDELRWEATRYLTMDYGTTNPFALYEIYDDWDTVYINNEYYYDSKSDNTLKQKTDGEYLIDFVEFDKMNPQHVESVIIDPSAASFRVLLRNEGYVVKDANNGVIEGIRVTSSAFHTKRLKINKRCVNLRNELEGYTWDSKAKDRGEEKPVKTEDHGCDAIRYYCNTVLRKRIEGRA